VVRLIRRVAPALPIHGSTQMSITSSEGAEFARALGVDRVVVGRELSVADIARVGAESPAEVEAFVHGALCVSYRCRRPPLSTPARTICARDLKHEEFPVLGP
jgi:putative protease